MGRCAQCGREVPSDQLTGHAKDNLICDSCAYGEELADPEAGYSETSEAANRSYWERVDNMRELGYDPNGGSQEPEYDPDPMGRSYDSGDYEYEHEDDLPDQPEDDTIRDEDTEYGSYHE